MDYSNLPFTDLKLMRFYYGKDYYFDEYRLKMKTNQLRIIAGVWRGRKITFPDVTGLRPTPNRVKETLFNWLQSYIVDAKCLELFAGSGSLSFEALSRGAGHVVLVEKNSIVLQSLEDNAQHLYSNTHEIGEIDIIQADCLKWLKDPKNIILSKHVKKSKIKAPIDDKTVAFVKDLMHVKDLNNILTRPFDIVFVDPPFAEKVLSDCFFLLEAMPWLNENAFIYFESEEPSDAIKFPENWKKLRAKKAGQVYYTLMQRT